MIKLAHLKAMAEDIPWRKHAMIEQDLVISRALIGLYENTHLQKRLVFRGGTALNKLYIQPPARYSEDIDLVQIVPGAIGTTIDEIRKTLSWLGNPRVRIRSLGVKMFFSYEAVGGGVSKLKIEINTMEHFHAVPLENKRYALRSAWFTGGATIVTYSLEELMATKLRALFQRRKGRDLFDTWYVCSTGMVAIPKAIQILHRYNMYNGVRFTQKMFANNLLEKKHSIDFRQDMGALLPADIQWDFDTAFSYVLKNVVPLI